MTDAQLRAKKKYMAKLDRVTVFFYPAESDLVAHLGEQENKQGFIKNLIREHLNKEKGTP